MFKKLPQTFARRQQRFSKWYTTVLVDSLHQEKEPFEWMNLHVGAERGVNCVHMQGLLTNLLQKYWEWQENRRQDLEPGGQAVGGVKDSFSD